MKQLKNNTKNVLVVDTSAIIYRFGFALKDVYNDKSEPCGGIIGLVRTIIKVSKKYNIFFVVCAGEGKNNNRKEIFPLYKSTREKTPDFIASQFEPCKKIMKLMNIPFISQLGYEADDIIGSLSNYITNKSKNNVVKILTIDKDMGQLINNKVHLLLMSRSGIKEFNSEIEFLEEWGIMPSQYTDYVGLAGDSSDNIPGIKGIGDKTAMRLLHQYDSISSIYDNINTVDTKTQHMLKNNFEIANMSKKLATINCNIPIDLSLRKCNNHEKWQKDNQLVNFLCLETGIPRDVLLSFFSN